jgi:hypothetical protein
VESILTLRLDLWAIRIVIVDDQNVEHMRLQTLEHANETPGWFDLPCSSAPTVAPK